MADDLFMGFDLSTQQIKCCVVDSKCVLVDEFVVDFEKDLPHYETTHGYYARADGSREVVAPVAMWLEGIDMVFDQMKSVNFPFSRVTAISGDAQQHGTVFWSKYAREVLSSLDSTKTLKGQLQNSFTRPLSPIWMDFSTSQQCDALRGFSGDDFVLETTGSVPTERFGGPQIFRVVQTNPDLFEKTGHISLISSFFCSLLVGKFAPIDFNEATGTNLFDFKAKKWSEAICNFISRDLLAKIGDVVASNSVVGHLSDYFVKRYGFEQGKCSVVAFTGDNAASLFSNGMKHGDILVSLGSSDTLAFVTDRPSPKGGCHIFGSALSMNEFFALCCFKNSSLARERVRDESGFKTWQEFDDAIRASTKSGNDGFFGAYLFLPESCPPRAVGVVRRDADGSRLEKFSNPAVECRAVLESQTVARLWHCEQSGFEVKPGSTRVLLTGGASKNHVIPQVYADVFCSEVYTTENANSAAYGSALRAMHGLGRLHESSLNDDTAWHLVARPQQRLAEVYAKLKQRYVDELANLLPK